MSCSYCKEESWHVCEVICNDCGYDIHSFGMLCNSCYDIYRDTETPRCEKCEDVLTFEIEQKEKEYEIQKLLGVKQCKTSTDI